MAARSIPLLLWGTATATTGRVYCRQPCTACRKRRSIRPASRKSQMTPPRSGWTITVSSVSKTFSATGWRIGWAIAPAPVTEALRRVHQFVTFTASSPLQRAVATLLDEAGPEFYAELTAGDELEFCERLIDTAGVAAIPASAFFAEPATGRGLVRFAFCKRLETLRQAGERLAAG